MAMTVTWGTYIEDDDGSRTQLTGESGSEYPSVEVKVYRSVASYGGNSGSYYYTALLHSFDLSGTCNAAYYLDDMSELGSIAVSNTQTNFWDLSVETSISSTPTWSQWGSGPSYYMWRCAAAGMYGNRHTASGTAIFNFIIKRKKYSISYELDGGEFQPGTAPPSTYTAGLSTTISLPEPEKTAYVFRGWYDNASFSGSPLTVLAISDTDYGDKTLYAKFEVAALLTVTLDADGGQVSPPSIEVYEGGYYQNLPTPTKFDRAFYGWWTEPAGGVLITDGSKVTATTDHTLYSHWGLLRTLYAHWEKYPTKDLYAHWEKLLESTLYAHWEKYPDKTLYAQWDADTTTAVIVFNGDGIVMNDPMLVINVAGQPVFGPLPEPVRLNFEFKGWFTDPVGGVRIQEGDAIPSVGIVNLYARWEPVGYGELIYDDATGRLIYDDRPVFET